MSQRDADEIETSIGDILQDNRDVVEDMRTLEGEHFANNVSDFAYDKDDLYDVHVHHVVDPALVKQKYGVKFALLKAMENARQVDQEPRPLHKQDLEEFVEGILDPVGNDEGEPAIVAVVTGQVGGDTRQYATGQDSVSPRTNHLMRSWVTANPLALVLLKLVKGHKTYLKGAPLVSPLPLPPSSSVTAT